MGVAIEPDQALMEAGLDSLAAVELRTAVAAKLGVAMPVTLAIDYPTLRVRSVPFTCRQYCCFCAGIWVKTLFMKPIF